MQKISTRILPFGAENQHTNTPIWGCFAATKHPRLGMVLAGQKATNKQPMLHKFFNTINTERYVTLKSSWIQKQKREYMDTETQIR